MGASIGRGVVVRWLRGEGAGREGGQGEVDGSLR